MAILGLEAALANTGAAFVVGSTSDLVDARPGDGSCATLGGACTLRAAIQEANALPGADLIEVPAGTYALTIPPLNDNGIETGDLDITGSVTISGAGADATVVDGGLPVPGASPEVRGLDRLFEVAVEGGTVAFDELTIRDGYATEHGGAIANNSTATVTVADSVLTGNVAEKSGGAIDNHFGGTVKVHDSIVSGNLAFENGSALNNNRDGMLEVVKTEITSNSATAVGLDETLFGAGAISNNAELDTGGTIVVTDSELAGNRAGGGRSGATISNDGTGTVTVERGAFSGNHATGDGGAIFNDSGDVEIVASIFSENSAADGGALYNAARQGSMSVRGSSFSFNTASGRGGAIVTEGTGALAVHASSFTGNSADDWGGAIVNDDKGSATIADSTFRENSGLSGGAFANEGSGLVKLENSTFADNSAVATLTLAGGEGGGVHSNSVGEVVITGGAFTGNEAVGGGGLSNEGGGRLTVTGTLFSANRAEESGGGILIESGDVRMDDIDVVGNTAGSLLEGGGGISYAGDKVIATGESAAIAGSRIRDNSAIGPGGGIDSRGDGPLDVVTTSITGNGAAIGGAIHHVGDAPLDVSRSTLAGNDADDGGGMFTDGDGETTVENSTVSGNAAGQFGGGLLVSSRLVLRSSTVARNTAAFGGGINNGGGDAVGDGSVLLANTIVADNPTGGNCAGTMTSLGGNVESADSCALRELSDQPGTNPLLGALADNGGPTRTHALLAGSPAQDKAVCTDALACPPVDQRNVARPLFAGFDAGAYESQTAPGGGGGQPCAGLIQRPIRADFDSWISQSSPASNFGSDATLKVESKPGANDRALVHFALPPRPPGCKLVGATLRLFSSSATDGHQLQALRVASPWSEGVVTWTNQPATAGAAATIQSGAGIREWDVLTQVGDMYAHGAHGFLIRDADENGSGEQSFHSHEKGEDPPELVLVFADPDAPPPHGDCPTNPQSVAANMDSWVSQSSPLNFFGSDSTLKVKSQLANNARALVRFPLPALPPGCSGVASATLQMTASSDTEGRTLEALQVASAWTESSVTWGSQPATTGPVATALTGSESLEWNVKDQLRAMYASANHGFLIRDAVEDDLGFEQTLNSRDKLNDGPPELVIVFEEGGPVTTIDSGPSGLINDSTPTFSFSSSDSGASFQCRVGSGEFTACTSPHTTAALPDGVHVLEVRSVGAAGTTGPVASRTINVDTTAPQTSIGGGPDGLTADPTPTFSFSSPDAGAGFQCRVGSGEFTACTSPHTTAALAEGTWTFEVRAFDAAGNLDATPATRTITVDTTAPQTMLGGPGGLTGDSTPTFTFSSSDAGASFRCRLGAGEFTACTSPHTTTALADGMWTFEVRAVDAAGNTGPIASRTITVDTTAPVAMIVDGPPATTRDTSARFTFAAEQGATFECSLDGGGWQQCDSPQDVGPLADGTHTFEVRATDAARNTGAAARYTWTIDTVVRDATPPDTALTDQPPALSRSASAGFSFSGSDDTTTAALILFECRLDSQAADAFAACGSPKLYAALADGAHRFEVRAVDAAGNRDASPATATWTIDTTAPVAAIDPDPTSPTRDTTPTFTFSSEPGARFECRVGSAEFAACDSPHTTAPLPDGTYTFAIRAIDAAGNTGPIASRSITVDTAAPQTTIGQAPRATTNDTGARFTFTADEDATFECSLDSGAFAECGSPRDYTNLAAATHSFSVRAKDAAGNIDATPAEYSWTIDTTAPHTTINAGPTGLIADSTPTFFFTSEPGARFECRVDTGQFAACTSPHTTAALSDATHTFEVRATDAAGNTGSAAGRAITIDTMAPDTKITEAPQATTNDTSAHFSFSAEQGATFECSLDGAAFADCTSPRDYADLLAGAHSFSVRAKDAAGNTDATAAAYSWTIDTTAPETTIHGPSGPISDPTPTFQFASEPGASFECRLDSATFTACISPYTTPTLADGTHTFEVRATDAAGNSDPTPASRTVTVDTTVPDTTAPDTALTENPPALSNSASLSFRFSGSDDATPVELVRFECRLDSQSADDFAPCESPRLFTGLSEGAHSFDVRAVDAAGNRDATPASHAWTVDTTAPEATIDPDPTGLIADSTPTFAFSSESGASLECRVDSGAFAACSSPHTPARLADGAHTFEVRATDAAGNVGAVARRVITVDTTAPLTAVDADPTGPTRDTTPTFSFSSEPGARLECRVGSAEFAACTSPHTVGPLADGTHTFDVKATDAAGNTGPVASRTITIDTTAPLTSLAPGPTGPTRDTTLTFTFSSEPGAGFQCRLGNAEFAACNSPHTVGPLADGTHTFEVRATDAAGNTGLIASRAVTIDTTAPETTIESGPDPLTGDSTPTFEFSSETGARFECRVGRLEFAACSSPHSVGRLDDGAHTFEVRAIDAAGNVGAPADHAWTIDSTVPDSTAPSTELADEPPALTRSADATFSFSGVDDRTAAELIQFECRLDSQDFTSCDSPKLYAALPDGEHRFEVRAVDAAANRDPSPETATWTIDTTAPATTIDAGPTGLIANPTPTFAFSSEPGATFECRVDTGGFTACTSPHTTPMLPDGPHTFEVKASDQAGNPGSAASRPVVVDSTAPDTTIIAGPVEGETVAATTVTFAFAAEQGAAFECALDGAAFEACTSPREHAGLTPGPHAFSVRATDGAGNVDGTPARRAWHVGSPVGVPQDTGGGGIGGSPPPPEASKRQAIRAKLSYAAKVRKGHTTLRSLRLTGVPAGALVRVTCDGRSCPRKSLRIASPAGGVVKLKPFQDERLRPGTTLTVRVSKTGMTDAVLVLRVRAGKPPRVT